MGSVSERIEPRPPIAHPNRTRWHARSDFSPRREHAPPVLDLDRIAVCDAPTCRICWCDPQVRLRLPIGQRGQRSGVIVEGMKMSKRASVRQQQAVFGIISRFGHWHRRQAHCCCPFRVKLDFPRGCREFHRWVGDVGYVHRDTAIIGPEVSNSRTACSAVIKYGVHSRFLISPGIHIRHTKALRQPLVEFVDRTRTARRREDAVTQMDMCIGGLCADLLKPDGARQHDISDLTNGLVLENIVGDHQVGSVQCGTKPVGVRERRQNV